MAAALPSYARPPGSPSSTSVSDGSGPEDFEDGTYTLETPRLAAPLVREWSGSRRSAADGGKSSAGDVHDDDERRGGGGGVAAMGRKGSHGVVGDRLPFEIWIYIIKLLPSPADVRSALLVSRAWCQIATEILWHKPALYRLEVLYRLLHVIDPKPIDDETISSRRTRIANSHSSATAADEELARLRAAVSSSRGIGGSEDGGSWAVTPVSSSTSSPAPSRAGHTSTGRDSKRGQQPLLWNDPSLLVDDPYQLSTSDIPPRTFPYASFIRRLNFCNVADALTDFTFFRLRTCDRLERLTLQGCSKLSDSVLAAVLGDGNMKELVALDLTNVKHVTDRTIIALARGCPRLQGLNLSGCRNVTDEGITAIAKNCRLLRRIKLVKCDLVTDLSVVLLARLCPLLLEVDLVDVCQITSVASRELWLYSSHLRELRLSSCVLLKDEGFPFLFPNLGNRLPAGGVGHSYAPTSLHPSTVGLPGSPGTVAVTDSEAAGSGTNSPIPPPNWMRAFDHLRVLDLTSCSLLTDQAVEAIVSNAPKIRSLVLAKCTGLTDESMASICRFGRSLHQLHMGHVAKITDGAVSRLARTCTRLRYIDLACCPLLTDMSVLELSQLPKLRRIGLVRVANLTDNAIHALVERPSSLERIHLSYCENISIEAIHYLLQRLNKLTHLSLTGVPAFRRADLQQYCRQPPKDFNPHQRQAFCVYSGSGVNDLRMHLASLFDPPSHSDATPSSPSSSTVSLSFDQDVDDSTTLERTPRTLQARASPHNGGSSPSFSSTRIGTANHAAPYNQPHHPAEAGGPSSSSTSSTAAHAPAPTTRPNTRRLAPLPHPTSGSATSSRRSSFTEGQQHHPLRTGTTASPSSSRLRPGGFMPISSRTWEQPRETQPVAGPSTPNEATALLGVGLSGLTSAASSLSRPHSSVSGSSSFLAEVGWSSSRGREGNTQEQPSNTNSGSVGAGGGRFSWLGRGRSG